MSPSARTEQRGASLSTKQIEQASLRGRLVGFRFFSTQPAHEVEGYVVGMDDYHWMVASRANEADNPVTLILLHKSKVDAVVLHPETTLDSEPDDIRDQVTRIGKSYWATLPGRNQEENRINV